MRYFVSYIYNDKCNRQTNLRNCMIEWQKIKSIKDIDEIAQSVAKANEDADPTTVNIVCLTNL